VKMNGAQLREWKRRIRQFLGLRNTFGDRIIIEDEVLVWEGRKLLFKSRGHIVNQGLTDLINWLACGTISATSAMPSNTFGTNGTIRVGVGTGVTVGTMTSLVSEQATQASSHSGATSSPSTGIYRVAWIATWNAGVLPAITVTEIGLKLFLDLAFRAFGAARGAPVANSLFSRLSDSDGDFTAFLVNTAVPLTIEWRLTYTFA